MVSSAGEPPAPSASTTPLEGSAAAPKSSAPDRAAKAAADPVAHVAFVGDVAMALHVKSYLEGESVARPPLEPGYPFGFVAERLRAYDLLVGNLECVVSSRGEARRPLPLNAPLVAPTILRDAGFDIVSVANNHSLDLGFQGYAEMLGRLRQVGLGVAGDHLAITLERPFVVREVSGVRIAVVGNYNRAHDDAVADVRAAKAAADVVLVFEHWGDDFVLAPEHAQRVLGRDLVDAGADAVIGAHAHVVQPEETYRGKLIVHGLGNFVFTGMTQPGTRTGALVELDVDKTGLVAHRYRRVAIDDRGSPRFVNAEPTEAPELDPPGPRVLPPL